MVSLQDTTWKYKEICALLGYYTVYGGDS